MNFNISPVRCSSLARRSLSASIAIAFSLFFSFFVMSPAHADDSTRRFWDPGAPIKDGQISAPTNNLQVAPGATVNCAVTVATDIDHWRAQYSPNGYEDDQVFYVWTGDGTFSNPGSASTTWTAPTAPGTYVLTCTTYDVAAIPPDDIQSGTTNPSSTRTDPPVVSTVTVVVRSLRTWDVGTSISGGRMKAPQDQRVSPGAPSVVQVEDSEPVDFQIEEATDKDHWKKGAVEEDSADSVTYTWTCTQGSFIVGTNADGTLQTAATAQGLSARWLSPSADDISEETNEDTADVTCTIDDTPTAISAGELGSRNDNALVRTLNVKIVVPVFWDPYTPIGADSDATEGGTQGNSSLQSATPTTSATPTGAPSLPPPNPPIKGGLFLKPQDQTKTPAIPAQVLVAAGQDVPCQVTIATDNDYVRRGKQKPKLEADNTVFYTWSAKDSAGVIVSGFTSTSSQNTTWKAPAEGGIYTLTCTIDDKPAPLPAGSSGNRNDPALIRSVAVTIVKVEMLNPTGDPIKSAEAREGVNEFTFNTEATGVLTIECEARLTPDNAATQAWAEQNVTWTVADIEGSVKTWVDSSGNAADEKGSSVFCTFTGLPAKNSAFGAKTVSMKVAGKETKRQIEVFFSRDATNHPALSEHPMYKVGANGKPNLIVTDDFSPNPAIGRVSVKWPNHVYYWLQTVTLVAEPPFITVGLDDQPSHYASTNKTLYFCDVARSYNGILSVNNPLIGIDNFGWTAIHESQHYKDWLDFWGADWNLWMSKNGLRGPDDDFDSDRIPNKIEDVNLNGVYDAGDLYDWKATTTAGTQSGRDDFEEWDYQRNKNAKGDHTKDWASPGWQHHKNDSALD